MNSDLCNGKPADFWIRFEAQFRDVWIIFFSAVFSSFLLNWILQIFLTDSGLYDYIVLTPLFWPGYFLFVAAIYYSWMTANGGQTVGKKIFNIKVVNREGLAIGIKQSLVRFFCYFLSTATFFIGFILPFFNRERKALHDYVTGTKVIYIGQPSAKKIFRVSVDASLIVLFITLAFLIVAPKFAGMLEKSREGTTKGNLGQTKEEILNYKSKHGVWPQILDNLLPVKTTGAYVRGSKSPSGKKITMARKGEVPSTSGKGWLYDSNLGAVYVNSTVKDSKAIPYSFYGFE